VIVADIGLAEDGYSFIQRVRAHELPAIQSVPAIAVTACAAAPIACVRSPPVSTT
jgi:hypothetical protein